MNKSTLNIKHRKIISSFSLPFCFLSLYLIFDYLYSGLSTETLRTYYLDYFVSFCGFIINIITPNEKISIIQNSIISTKANLSVVRTCDGSTTFFLISAAILVVKSKLKLTIVGIFIALILILSLNTIRIVSLFYLIPYDSLWFSYFHETIAPFLLVSISCGYFSFWAQHANKVKRG